MMSGKSEWLDCSDCSESCYVGSQQNPAFYRHFFAKPLCLSVSHHFRILTLNIRRYILIYLGGLGYFKTIIYNMRTRPDVCEWFRGCPNPALIHYAFSDIWLCSYCIGDTRMELPLCAKDGWRRGSCVDTDSQQWFCDSHAVRCEAIVGRPQGQSIGNSHRCMRIGALYESNVLDRYYCIDHMPDNQVLHDAEPVANVAISPPMISQTLLSTPHLAGVVSVLRDHPATAVATPPLATHHNLDIFSAVVDTECCTCFEPQRSMRRLIACNHMFCEDCLSKQINGPYARAHDCPLCRKDIFDLRGTE